VDRDGDRARARADHVADALEPLARARTIDGFDALATLAPAEATQLARLDARDALDLPARRADLASALRAAGFDESMCAPALDAFAHPSRAVARTDLGPDAPLALLAARHVAHDEGDTLVAAYVRPKDDPDADARALAAIRAADPDAVVTSFVALDRSLKDTLARDLVLVGGVALAIVAIALRLALRSASGALIALGALAVEIAAVGLAMRALHVRWHVYDALVIPVLLGVTIDEAMFLLHAARTTTQANALRTQGPLVASTALTTAAGFASLLACRFEGLFDLGCVGTLGVIVGLAAALVVVPAGLALTRREAS
jgi:hypothetical protein